MKRLILITILSLVTLHIFSQNIVAKRNTSTPIDSTTTFTYQIDTVKYPVYRSRNNKFYIWKTSKVTAKKYKYYLPKDVQITITKTYKTESK